MEEISKEMQGLIEFETQNKSRTRGTLIENDGIIMRLSSCTNGGIKQKIKEIVCNPQRKTFIKDYRESKK